MPSVIGSPTRKYTPPSSTDESHHHHLASVPHASKLLHPHPSSHPSTTALNIHTTHHHNDTSNPASPPSSSDDSPTTSTGPLFTTTSSAYLSGQDDDTEMLDYNYPDITSVLNNPTSLTGDDCSSPEALFFGPSSSSTNLGNNRFTTTTSGVDDSAMSPFSAALAGLQGVAASGGGGNGSSPEYAVEGDSPGLGTEMRGLRINSRFPSPVQGTVRLEDVMLPSEDVMSGLHQQTMSNGSLFTQDHEDNKAHVQQPENGFFQRYP